MDSMKFSCLFIAVSLFSVFQDVTTLQCQPGEFPSYIVAGNIVLDVSGVPGAATPTSMDGVQDAVACQQQCDGLAAFVCTSFTFSPVTNKCIIYPLRASDEGVVTETRSDVFHYIGICSETPNLDNCTDTNVQVDLAFVVDGSGSICDDDPTQEPDLSSCQNWRSLLTFIKLIINVLPIGPDTTRVSLISFANEGKVEFHFDSYSTKAEVEDAINRLAYPGGNTNTYEGLYLMRESVFNASNGDRPEGRDVALVITDGFPTFNVNETEPQALAAQAEGIIMYAVGITNRIDESWLRIFSSQPKELGRNYFRTPDFSSLNPVISSLLSAACIRLDPVLMPTTPTTTFATTTQGTTTTTEAPPTPSPTTPRPSTTRRLTTTTTSQPPTTSTIAPTTTTPPTSTTNTNDLITSSSTIISASLSATAPETTSTAPATAPGASDGESEIETRLRESYEFLRDNPEYAAMIGMGVLIILLFITAIVILCCYQARGASDSDRDKYRDQS